MSDSWKSFFVSRLINHYFPATPSNPKASSPLPCGSAVQTPPSVRSRFALLLSLVRGQVSSIYSKVGYLSSASTPHYLPPTSPSLPSHAWFDVRTLASFDGLVNPIVGRLTTR